MVSQKLLKQKDRRVLCAISGGVDSSVAAALLIKAGYEVTGAFIKCYSDTNLRIYPNKFCQSIDSFDLKGYNAHNLSNVLEREAKFEGVNANDTNNANIRSDEAVLRQSNLSGVATCWIDERRDALRVAAKLGIKLLTFDFEKEYRRFVVDYLFREYKAGRTPNPDVVCNQRVKIPLLLREANPPAGGLGFDYVATGHYARLRREIPSTKSSRRNVGIPTAASGQIPNKFQAPNPKSQTIHLLQGIDQNKDQSYFLHQLKQSQLKHILFPLGALNKEEVRHLARQWHLPVAEKEESMGICFIGEVKIQDFLRRRIKEKPGEIVLPSGERVGKHKGLAFYTIGQRVGIKIPNKLQISNSKPFYVVAKDLKKNLLIIDRETSPLLYKKDCLVKNVNWLAGQPPKLPWLGQVRLRHRQPLEKCSIAKPRANKSGQSAKSDIYRVNFARPQRAVTPGQFAVFYLGEECLGGGVIEG